MDEELTSSPATPSSSATKTAAGPTASSATGRKLPTRESLLAQGFVERKSSGRIYTFLPAGNFQQAKKASETTKE
jgi:hypothetical protein